MPVLAKMHVPLVPLVESNSRKAEHWRTKKERADRYKETVFAHIYMMPAPKRMAIVTAGKLMVKMTVISSHKPDDDNLAGMLKHYRDEVARFLECDDGDESKVVWMRRWVRYDKDDQKQGVVVEFIPFAEYLVEAKSEIEAQMKALGLKT